VTLHVMHKEQVNLQQHRLLYWNSNCQIY